MKNKKRIIEEDYKVGMEKENNIYKKLRLKGYTINSTPRYCFYDFKINEKYVCEIKSRKCFKNRFNTTLLPYSKIDEYKKIKKNYKDFIFIFDFLDGAYYTTYKKLCKTRPRCQVKPFTRYAGFIHKTKSYVYIPTSLLVPLDNLVLVK